jgi:TP901-1 family phage major tail protein
VQILVGTTAASGVFTLTGDAGNAETVTIGTRVYEFDTAAPPGSVVAGNVRVDVSGGAGLAAAATALIAAINGDSGAVVTAVTGGAGVVNVTAKEKGTNGNLIAKAETCADGDWDGVGAFLTSGADTVIALQRGGDINFTTDTIDVTTKDDEFWKQFLAGHTEGEITCDGLLDITDTAQATLRSAQAAGTPLTVVFGLDGATPTDYFKGVCYVTAFKPEGAHDGAQQLSATLKVTGVVALTV